MESAAICTGLACYQLGHRPARHRLAPPRNANQCAQGAIILNSAHLVALEPFEGLGEVELAQRLLVDV